MHGRHPLTWLLSLAVLVGAAAARADDARAHQNYLLLPIAGKGDSDWGYAWVPIVGPIIGGVLGAVCYKALWPL